MKTLSIRSLAVFLGLFLSVSAFGQTTINIENSTNATMRGNIYFTQGGCSEDASEGFLISPNDYHAATIPSGMTPLWLEIGYWDGTSWHFVNVGDPSCGYNDDVTTIFPGACSGSLRTIFYTALGMGADNIAICI